MNILDFHIEGAAFVLLIIFLSALFIQLVFYLFIFSKPLFFKQKGGKEEKHPVSVIICARNEAKNLKKYLSRVLEQDWPEYEVIVVNDCSTDETEEVLSKFSSKYKHLRTTTIEKDRKFTHGKKLALTVGIKAAKHEWLLLIDADCHPVGKNWIKEMACQQTQPKEIVLGYGGYQNTGGITNNLIRFDTFFIGLQYLSLALAGLPYMGVGRNLSYRKSLFFKNKGFASHYHIHSGDDDLFVNETARAKNTAVQISRDSLTLSEPEKTIGAWFRQKRRHVQTGKRYKFKHKLVLFMEIFSRIVFYATFALFLIVFPALYPLVLAPFLFRTVIQLIIYKFNMNRLMEKNLLLPSLVYDILFPLVNFLFYIANLFTSERNTWK
jgi:glycosyltransferase involved in cell wall biosynthesis